MAAVDMICLTTAIPEASVQERVEAKAVRKRKAEEDQNAVKRREQRKNSFLKNRRLFNKANAKLDYYEMPKL